MGNPGAIESEIGSPPAGTFRTRIIKFVALTILFTAIAGLLQWRSGVFHGEFSSYPDEPAHLVTGLMVRDYVVSGMKSSPMRYAEDYYLHYPKVGFGIWPPLFHFVEAFWFVVTPPSKASAFLLQALLIGMLAGSLSVLAVKRFGWLIGLAAGCALVALPRVQEFTAMVMADHLMALIAFWSMIAFAAWIRDGRLKQAALFGLLVGLAVMTKSNGAALAFLPLIALGLMRRYRRVVAPGLFLAAGIALVIALPWQLLVMSYWTGTVSANAYSLAYALKMLRLHARMYYEMPGAVVFVLAAVGAWDRLIQPYRRGTIEPFWASVTGLIAGMFLFGLAPLPPEPRYHVAAVAGILLFAGAGLRRISQWIPASVMTPRRAELAVTGLAVLLFATITFSIPRREVLGFSEAAQGLMSNPDFHDAVMLISSENFGEGMFVAEVALRDQRPGHYVLRASKILSTSRWNADEYHLLHSTPEEVQASLEEIPVRLLVVDHTPSKLQYPHQALLDAMLAKYPEKWKHIESCPSDKPNALGGRVDVYELQGAATRHTHIRIDMLHTLHRVIEEQ
jgi:hypothetical protein